MEVHVVYSVYKYCHTGACATLACLNMSVLMAKEVDSRMYLRDRILRCSRNFNFTRKNKKFCTNMTKCLVG